jgi:hypothetical protein
LEKQGSRDEAQREYQHALVLNEPLAIAQPFNQQAQYTVAKAYAGLGEISTARAAQENRPARRNIELKDACSWYRKSVAIWRQIPHLQARTPNGFDAMDANEVAQRLASCTAILPKLIDAFAEQGEQPANKSGEIQQ